MSGTLILGLGNPVLTDDAVGLRVVERLQAEGLPEGVRAEVAGTAGLGILDLLDGEPRLILVDAVDARMEPGAVVVLGRAELEAMGPLHLASSHDLDLPGVLELGSTLGQQMPSEVYVVGVQVADVRSFSELCTPAVEAAIPAACGRCRELIEAP